MLLSLADWSNDEGEVVYGTTTLAGLAFNSRMVVRQARRVINQLEADGVIEVTRGKGRGHRSRYRIIADKLNATKEDIMSSLEGVKASDSHSLEDEKGTKCPPLDDEKRGHSEQEKGTFSPIKEDISCTAIDIDVRTKARKTHKPAGTDVPDAPDPRHAPLREAIQAKQREALEGSTVWDGRCAKALDLLLKASGAKEWPLERLLVCVDGYFASEVNPADHPAFWLPKLTNWAAGPQDRFRIPVAMDKRRREATVGMAVPAVSFTACGTENASEEAKAALGELAQAAVRLQDFRNAVDALGTQADELGIVRPQFDLVERLRVAVRRIITPAEDADRIALSPWGWKRGLFGKSRVAVFLAAVPATKTCFEKHAGDVSRAMLEAKLAGGHEVWQWQGANAADAWMRSRKGAA